MAKLVVHVAEVDLSEESGMGRVGWHWKHEFERRGYEFLHIGPAQVGSVPHPAWFPYAAYRAYQRLGMKASLFLVHEPASGAFVHKSIPTVVISHGLERRFWQLALEGNSGLSQKIKLRTKILFPIWRLRHCDLGLGKADLVLLINQQDAEFAQKYYRLNQQKIFVFKNGVVPSYINENIQPNGNLNVIFLGSWIERKGIKTLVQAAQLLYQNQIPINWIVAGTNIGREKVLNFWASELHHFVEIMPHFSRAMEENLFARSHVFVLPSFFEGQSLALLQAMETGRCCITTDCCGQRDLIQDGYNGLLHQPGDAQHLAFLIERCAQELDLRTNLGKNAKLSVKNRAWETVSAEVIDRIEKLLS
ncbi:MAG TPA: group 1 glycosyl transferase [Cyanobacteria bacterium UBA8803]|nr:group 1 glycosyl transferase [Cyanobacteria bacterium UBA9273]HBL61328.1 group 1 glycosyl transferase [Cyanobacteria bacterium UBA8803]